MRGSRSPQMGKSPNKTHSRKLPSDSGAGKNGSFPKLGGTFKGGNRNCIGII